MNTIYQRAEHLFSETMTRSEIASEKRFTIKVLWGVFVATLIAAIVFSIWPRLDFILTDWVNAGSVFAINGDSPWSFIRRALMWGFAAFYILVVIGLIRSAREGRKVWSLSAGRWLYLVLCSLAGPLLVANIILKSNVGRPRPRAVVEYGGELDFTPVFQAGGKCLDNCSFVSGEVSSMVMIIVALLFACNSLRRIMAIVLIPAWALASYVRIAMGAHFPSDAIFAGLFMILIAGMLWWVKLANSKVTDGADQPA